MTAILREGVTNPYAPNCALHLRRVCGVCREFDGALRGNGHCGKLNLPRAGRDGAGDCLWWTRKTQPAAASQDKEALP